MVLLLTSALALAGYGDPVMEGIPSPAERGVHVWTNAVRMDPEGFAGVYPCSFDAFTTTEQTPQLPLLWNADLAEAARFHSDDMAATGNFSHTSSDGTPMFTRLARYYDSEMVGENIAQGTPDPYSTVVQGWMCSSGHRENIMLPDWDELGTGVAADYWTQDFGWRGLQVAAQPISMGAHSPPAPTGTVTYLANFYDPAGPPEQIEVVVNGSARRLELEWGADMQGTYTVTADVADGCTTYFFRADLADGGVAVFPSDGVYGFGGCDFDDAGAGWIAGRDEDADPPGLPGSDGLGNPIDTGATHFGIGSGDDDDDPEHRQWRRCGCDTHGSGVGWSLLLLPLLLSRRTPPRTWS